ncbi:MAG TPA: M4 family metallopeptidase [Lysobacter sp.]|nr:M4 family metallopeptidase [Lysobacter sp.]
MNHHHRLAALAAATSLALTAGGAVAAQRVDLHRLDAGKLNQQYRAATAHNGLAATPRTRHAEMLGLDANSSLRELRTSTDKDGTKHYRYQQTFRGIPVWGEHVIVTEGKDGNVRNLFGRMASNLAGELPAVAAKLTPANALALGKGAGLGNRIGFMRTENEKSEPVIFIDDNDRAHLAYVVSFFADTAGGGSPTRPFVILDAQNGRILKQWDGLTHAQGTGPGGNAKTGQYEYTGLTGLHPYLDVTQSGTTCTMTNTNVKSVNLAGSTGAGTTAFSYTCPRNTFKAINGAYSPINDAHFFGGVIQNMYNSYTGENALSFQLIMRVHYGTNYENAFWNGSYMSFGDGASTFYPLVNADVSGHEVSHGYTEQHSNLTYSGQSGGMNEAFSDMGGEATEYFWKGTNDFDVGREIFKDPNGALRYMCTPSADGGSIENASQYTSGLDVHYSSGVYNKAFCTLAKKAGWNTPTAFKVFALANKNYWTPSSTFNSGACGVETAAQDLGLNKADVTAAFSVVGVSCAGGGGGGGTTALTKGVTVTGIGASTGNSANYSLVVPAGSSNLTFTMSGGTGDADMYVKFGSAPTDTVYDCRPYKTGNAETCTFAAPSAGTYYVRLKAYSTFSGVSLKGDYSTGGGGSTQTYTNTTDVSIGDNTTVESPISVTGRTGNAPANAQVAVNIVHTYIGDLKVDLVAPDGSIYTLHNRAGGSADNINTTYTVNLSTEVLNGTWKLRVNDNAAGDTGYINQWSVTF